MSYVKTTWHTGDVVTSAKLNNMEDGIANAGGGMVINVAVEGDTWTLDKTWQEVFDAFSAGIPCVVIYDGCPCSVAFVIHGDTIYTIGAMLFLSGDDTFLCTKFECNAANSYPTYED